MILADTNLIIDFWDKPTEDAKKIFEENERRNQNDGK